VAGVLNYQLKPELSDKTPNSLGLKPCKTGINGNRKQLISDRGAALQFSQQEQHGQRVFTAGDADTDPIAISDQAEVAYSPSHSVA
jgi:hypothetical protein